MSLETFISAAEDSLGLTGRPNYITTNYAARNGTEFTDAPWCDMGITYWARRSGEFSAVCLGIDYAYTVAHAQAFNSAGLWHPGADGVQRGDIVFMNWGAPSRNIATIDHVGVCTGVYGSNALTIEANTLDTVARRVRGTDVIVGYGRPHYTTPSVTGWPTVSLAHLRKAFEQDRAGAQGHTTYPAEVRTVETALARHGMLAWRWVDGSGGTMTWAAYSRWQQECGYSGTAPGQAADGCPGPLTLSKLGALAHFHVIA